MIQLSDYARLLHEQNLKEAPLGSYQTFGFDDDAKKTSFHDPRDFSLVKNPINIQNVKNMFKNSPVDFDLFFVNKPGLRKFTEERKVNYEFLVTPYPNGLGLNPNEFTLNTDNISIFYVSNVAAQKVPMTAWTIAHRVGHAIANTTQFREYSDWLERRVKQILQDAYGVKEKRGEFNQILYSRKYQLIMGYFFEAIGTMRSAREGKLHLRPFEFYFELLAQYLKDGKVTFNSLPEKLIVGHAYGKKQFMRINPEKQDDYDNYLKNIEHDVCGYLEDALFSIKGDIFVM